MICGVLLAGGEGARFGGDKLAARLPDGTPLALAAARSLAAGADHCVLVTRPGRGWLVEALVADHWTPVVTSAAERGMGASLAAGVGACADAEGWLIALADMPMVRPASVIAVADALRRGAYMAVPECARGRGHPVGFAAGLRPRLLALGGDAGARAILETGGDAVTIVPVDDGGILLDVDRPEDLVSLNRRSQLL